MMSFKMIKLSVAFFVLFFCLIACAQNNREKADILGFKEAVYQKSACVGEEETCAEVKINYPEFTGPRELSSWLNLHVKEQLLMYLTWGETATAADSLGAAADMFLDEFVAYGTEFPESVHGWFNQVEGKVNVLEGNLLSMVFSNSTYTGGAHPNHTVLFMNFDLEERYLLKNGDIILDEPALFKMAEEAFREYHEVDPEVSLEEDGRFFLQEGSFFLPKAMGYEDGNFIMVYNSYEIGPYSMGQTELSFPLKDLKGIVRQ